MTPSLFAGWAALAVLAAGCAAPARAGGDASRAGERAAARALISQQRQDIQAELKRLEAACYQRFAVEDCLRRARADARMRDNLLWREELEIDEAERRDKAAQRLQSVQQRQQDGHAGPQGNEPAAPAPQAQGDAGERAQQAHERATEARRRRAAHAAEQQRRAQEQAERLETARQRHEERQRKARERREEHDRRRAEEAAQGKLPAQPLPTPDASVAPAHGGGEDSGGRTGSQH